MTLRLMKTATIVLIFACGVAANAQACPHRPVIVNAFDVQGRPIATLGTPDFNASSAKGTVEVSSASFRRDPSVRTIVLLDTRRSMAWPSVGTEKWRIARDAALEFVSALPAQANVALWNFDTQVQHRAAGQQAITEWLNAEAAPAKVERRDGIIYSAIMEALNALKPAHPGDAIYIITDGWDTGGVGERSQTVAKLQSNSVRLFAFLLTNAATGPLPDEPDWIAEPTHLDEMARATGGLAFRLKEETAGKGWAGSGFFPSYSEQHSATFLRSTGRWVEGAMSDFYVLTVNAGPFPNQQNWKLEIVDAQKKERKDVVLAYPNTIDGCSNSSSDH